jgi:squalene-hopene/tetraprenyl-beta-curcumene cyclase
MTAEAMEAAGVPKDNPFWQEARLFLEHTQNSSEWNQLPWVEEGPNDGGFVYAPALKDNLAMGESKAGAAGPNDRGLRSYGTMTYIGFKSMIYAGLSRDDKRVRAAQEWIRRHWRLDSNPNMPQRQSLEGLYYYYHVFARALRVWGQDEIADAEGTKHNWRHELIDALAERQREDGSWVNAEDRWYESDPILVTGYVALALEEAMKK